MKNRTINKTELKYIISNNLNGEVKCGKMNMYRIIDEVFKVISDELAEGNSISITNFGKFEVTNVSEHYGRNAQDPTEVIKIESYNKVGFKAGQELKDKINSNNKKRR